MGKIKYGTNLDPRLLFESADCAALSFFTFYMVQSSCDSNFFDNDAYAKTYYLHTALCIAPALT